MLKKTVAIGISVLTLMLAIASRAQAAGGTISGTSVSSCLCYQNNPLLAGADILSPTSGACPSGYTKKCSIDLRGILQGLGNLTRASCLTTGDPATDCAAIHVATLFLEDAFFGCFNPANNAFNAKGVPFIGVQLGASDVIDADSISQNGSAETLISFADADIVQSEILACAFDIKKKGQTCPAGYTDIGSLACDPLRPCRPTSQSVLCKEKWNPIFLISQLQAFGELFTKYQDMSACDAANPTHDGFLPTAGQCPSGFGLKDGHCHLQATGGSCPLGPSGEIIYAKLGNLCYSACARPDALDVQCFAPTPTPVVPGFEYVGANGSPPCDTLCHDSAIAPTNGLCPSGYVPGADGLCHAPACPLQPELLP